MTCEENSNDQPWAQSQEIHPNRMHQPHPRHLHSAGEGIHRCMFNHPGNQQPQTQAPKDLI